MTRTIDIHAYDIPMSVRFDYEPGQAPVLTGPHASPGYDPAVIVESVFIGGVNVYEMLSNEQLERIEDRILRALED